MILDSPQPGTLTTVAGAGFCPGPSTKDPASTAVRALSVDSQGRLFFDTGTPGEGLIGKVDEGGRASLLRSGVRGAADPLRAWGREPAASAAGRLAADGNGGVYIAAGTKVVHLDAHGAALTSVSGPPGLRAEAIAGGSAGDGGPVREARFNSIQGLSTDDRNNLVVADQIDPKRLTLRLRYINLGQDRVTFFPGTPWQTTIEPGTVNTILGGGDKEAVEDSPFGQIRGIPPSIAVTGDRLYLAVYSPGEGSRRGSAEVLLANMGPSSVVAHGVTVGPGEVRSIAGGGPEGAAKDGDRARDSRLSYMPGIAIDPKGNLLIADEKHHRIRKVDPNGIITTFAGGGPAGLGAGPDRNGIKASRARLNRPYDVKTDGAGKVYISDRLNAKVRVVDSDGLIHTAPGAGLGRSPICEREAGSKRSSGPVRGPVTGATGHGGALVFSVSSLPAIKRLESSGRIDNLDSPGGNRPCSAGAGCGPGQYIQPLHLIQPDHLAADERGGLYVLDRQGPRLFYINAGRRAAFVDGQKVTSGASRSLEIDLEDSSDGPDAKRLLESVSSLAVHGRDLFMAAGGTVLHMAAGGRWRIVLGQNRLLGECCSTARILATDRSGNLYIAEESRARIWLLNRQRAPLQVHGVTVAPGGIERIAGRAECPLAGGDQCSGFGGDGGPAREAQFRIPSGMALDEAGNLYISDRMEHTIRRINAAGTIDTVAGSGQPGFNGDGLPGRLALLSSPAHLVFDGCKNLLINDQGNQRIRRLNLSAAKCERP